MKTHATQTQTRITSHEAALAASYAAFVVSQSARAAQDRVDSLCAEAAVMRTQGRKRQAERLTHRARMIATAWGE